MKTFFLLLALFASCIYSSTALLAQSCEGPAILFENFNSGSIPSGWTILAIDTNELYPHSADKGLTGQWQSHNFRGRQCASECSRFLDITAGCDDYLITPAVQLGAGPVCLSWKSAKGSAGHSDEEYDVLISNTTPTIAGLQANPSLAVIVDYSEEWKNYSVDLSAYAGQNVYIGFWHHTLLFGYLLSIDDVRIASPVLVDATISDAELSDVILPGTIVTPACSLYNGGLTTLTDFTLNWNVNGGVPNIYSVSGVSVAPGTYYSATFPTTWTAGGTGTYVVKFWADNLNGANDMYALNDTSTQYVFVSTHQRKVLEEEFTQASCPPCATVNPAYNALLDPNRAAGKVTMLKYQVGWPGFDPMYNLNPDEVVDRVAHYGVLFAPSAFQDGMIVSTCQNGWSGGPLCVTQQGIDSLASIPSIFNIGMSSMKTGTDFNVTYNITALTDFPLTGFRVYAAVLEDSIDYFGSPPGTNGETVFHQVMRKMLPDADGVPLPSLLQNQVFTQNFSIPILPDYTEDQLRVIVFVEDNATQRIYQSGMTNQMTAAVSEVKKDDGIKVFPVPSSDKVYISFDGLNAASSMIVVDIFGKTVLSKDVSSTGNNIIELDVKSFSPGVYFVQLSNGDELHATKFVKD